jgi:glycosyltransferase involved in cell wall biosynthesis
MKIIKISSYYPPHLGGVENVAKEISERLAKKGHQVEVFTSDIECQKDKQLKSTKNLKIHYLSAKEVAHMPIIPLLYKELMKIPQNSVIHVHLAQAYVPEIVYKIWKKRRIPYIAQVHCDLCPSSLLGKLILEPYKKLFLKRFLKCAKEVIVLTEGYKELISNKYLINNNKITVIPNGVGEEFFTKNKKKNKIPHLLFVSRISIEKNLPRLIESIYLCKSNFILDIVGDGDLLEETKRLVKQKNLKNIIFHGRKTGKDLVNIYKNSDVFISTSNGEAFPLTILEAMASRLPVIASDVKGNHDVVKEVGILVNPPNPENFAKEIDKLFLDKRLLDKLANQSLKFANEHRWGKIVNELEGVYEDVLKENNNETTKSKIKKAK